MFQIKGSNLNSPVQSRFSYQLEESEIVPFKSYDLFFESWEPSVLPIDEKGYAPTLGFEPRTKD